MEPKISIPIQLPSHNTFVSLSGKSVKTPVKKLVQIAAVKPKKMILNFDGFPESLPQ